MTQDQFYKWLKDPMAMNADSIPQLREVIKRYPYFSAAQMMLAKNLRSENHIDQIKQLQLAAIVVPDRKVFHDYLNDKQRVKPTGSEEKEEVSLNLEPAVGEPDLSIVKSASEGPLQEPKETVLEPRFPDELIPEPIVYQLETAELPELPLVEEENPEPEELSFADWLSFTESGKLDATEKVIEALEGKRAEKRSNIELIDHFLTQAEDVPKKRAEFFDPRKVAAKADEGDFTVVSETLAKIYFQQEKYELAKQAYEALSLKYPEKSVYFAARLKEVDRKLKSEH